MDRRKPKKGEIVARADKRMTLALQLRVSRDRLRILKRLKEASAYGEELVTYAALIGKWEELK